MALLQITNAQTGVFTYTPTPTYNGTDSFTYRVTDSQSLTDDATVTIAVRSVNSPPVAGRNGVLLTFDGANDIVDLGNVACRTASTGIRWKDGCALPPSTITRPCWPSGRVTATAL